MTDSRLTLHQPAALSTDLRTVSDAADAAASRHLFNDYRMRRARNTREGQSQDLRVFEAFLSSVGIDTANLDTEPDGWRGVTWGLVSAFVAWQLQAGYAIATINRRLSTVKTYARLASQAGVLSADALVLIRAVQQYGHSEGKRIDAERPVTRVGRKKAENVTLTASQVYALKHHQPDTPQGRRDSFLMCLLLDHGLRVSEIVGLRVKNFAEAGYMVFFRQKVNKTQRHRLTDDTYAALELYRQDAPTDDDAPIMMASTRSGRLVSAGVTRFGLTKRVNQLGKVFGVPNLSSHDGRHVWATRAANAGTGPFVLQEAGGWNSLTMPRRYITEATVSNEGVKL